MIASCDVLWARWVVLEVRVVAGLLGRDAAGRVVDEHHLQEVETLVIKVLAEGLAVIPQPLGEGGLKVRVRCHSGPDILCGGTKQSTGVKLECHFYIEFKEQLGRTGIS